MPPTDLTLWCFSKANGRISPVPKSISSGRRDGPGQIEELAVEIGFRFVNRMSHLATPDAFESRNHSHSTGFEMPRVEDLWDMEQYLLAPFPFVLTTKSQWQQCISLEMRRILETTLEPSRGFRPNYPWYGKNWMERKKKMILCADVKALSIEAF